MFIERVKDLNVKELFWVFKSFDIHEKKNGLYMNEKKNLKKDGA